MDCTNDDDPQKYAVHAFHQRLSRTANIELKTLDLLFVIAGIEFYRDNIVIKNVPEV